MATTAKTNTPTTTGTTLSNEVSVVGRKHIHLLDAAGGQGTTTASQSAVIISYNPDNNAHTVESSNGSCPCCKMADLKKDALRSVTLVPWPEKPDHSTTRKRKQIVEKKQAPVAAAAAAAATKTAGKMEDDDDDDDEHDCEQTGSSDSDHEEPKPSEKRIKLGSKPIEAHDDDSSDYSCDHDQAAGLPDSQQKPKKRKATRSSRSTRTSMHSASLAKSPAGPRARKRTQAKYLVGTRFIKEFEGRGKFEGIIVNFDGNYYQVYYPEDGDKESLSEYELDELEIVDDDDQQAVAAAAAAASSAKDCWCSSGEEELEQSSDDDDTSSMDSEQPRFPIGTRFIKEFPGHGRFEGRVVDFDGKRYEVHYPQDGDDEVILESELEKLEILVAKHMTTGHSKKTPPKKKDELL